MFKPEPTEADINNISVESNIDKNENCKKKFMV